MNKNSNEWNENNYEPGLFTFYLEQAEKGYISKQFHPPKFKFHCYNPFFQAPIHFNKQQKICKSRNPQRLSTYIVGKSYNRGNFSERRLQRAKTYTEPCSDENLYNSNVTFKDDNKPCIKLNKNNINHFFNFDLKKTRAQVDLHKGQSTHSHKLHARYLRHQQQGSGLLNQETKEYLKVQPIQQKSKQSSIKKTKSLSTNSENKLKNSSSFQRFYENRQKMRIIPQQTPRQKNIQSVLQRFIQINKQKIHQSTSILEKQA